jgi:hypothetical protein
MSPDLTRAVAGHGLPGARLAIPDQPLDDAAWQWLLGAVRVGRLSGFLVDAIGAEAFPVTDEQSEQALALHATAMAMVLRLDRLLLEATSALEEIGVDSRLLKGAALAHLDYPEPALRSYGDVDLLVRSPDFEAAVERLCKLGFTREAPELRQGFDQKFGKGAALVGPNGLELDVHRTFVGGRFGLTIPLDELFAEPRALQVGGKTLLALSDLNRLLHACFHAAIGQAVPGLLAQRDVVQLTLSLTGTEEDAADQALFDTTRRWRCEPIVARAICDSWEVFQLADPTALTAWSHRYAMSPEELRQMRAYIGEDRRYARQAIGGFTALRGFKAKASYVRAHIGGGNFHRVLRSARALASGRSRQS